MGDGPGGSKAANVILVAGAGAMARAATEAVAAAMRGAWPTLTVTVTGTGGPGMVEPPAAAEAARRAVRTGRAHVAVQRAADLATQDSGLTLACVPRRGDPTDALVSRRRVVFPYLAPGARVGTCSRRRMAQLRRRRRDLVVSDVGARAAELASDLGAGHLDALVLASAELKGLGLGHRIDEAFDVDVMVPSVGQGAVALEVKADDLETQRLVAPLNHEDSFFAVMAEAACQRRLGAAPDAPIGVHIAVAHGDMTARATVLSDDGRRAAKMRWSGPRDKSPAEVGAILADLILATAAPDIIAMAGPGPG